MRIFWGFGSRIEAESVPVLVLAPRPVEKK